MPCPPAEAQGSFWLLGSSSLEEEARGLLGRKKGEGWALLELSRVLSGRCQWPALLQSWQGALWITWGVSLSSLMPMSCHWDRSEKSPPLYRHSSLGMSSVCCSQNSTDVSHEKRRKRCDIMELTFLRFSSVRFR